MSDLTRSSDAGLEGNSGIKCNPQTRQAGVTLANGEGVYIDSNGLLQKSVSTVNPTGETGTVAFAGLVARNILSGSFGEVYGNGAEFFYADSGLTIGASLWASAAAGKLGDARVGTSVDRPVAMVVSATNIILTRGV